MPRAAVKDSSRMSLRIRSDDKALLVQAAKAVIAQAEQMKLSERDSLRVLQALENPPPPTAKLLAVAHVLPLLS